MAHLLPNVKQTFFDTNGAPLVGGKLYSYLAGTSTPAATYTDQTEGAANTNPVILDANGEANVWISSGSYKFVLKDSLDVVQWTVDNVSTIANGEITTIKLADNSVTTAKIVDLAVTRAKLPDSVINAAKIEDGAVIAAKIPDASLGFAKLSSTTDLLFQNTGESLIGGGSTAFPRVPWLAPSLVANPTVTPAGTGNAVAWSPSGDFLAVSENSSGFASIYQRSSNTLKKLAGLDATPASQSLSVAWSPNSEFIALTDTTTFRVELYQRYANSFRRIYEPDVMPTGDGYGVQFSPNGEFLAVAHNTTPFVSIYQRSDSNHPSVVARYSTNTAQSFLNNIPTLVDFEDVTYDPASAVTVGSSWQFQAPRSNGYSVKAMITWASSAAWSSGETVKMFLYKNGSAYSLLDSRPLYATAPAIELCMTGADWVYLNAGDVISIVLQQASGATETLNSVGTDNHITITEDPGFIGYSNFTKVSNPGTLPTGNAKALAWSPDSKFLAVAHATTPFITIYSRSGTTFTKIANPATLPAGLPNAVAWSQNGQFLALALSVTPFLAIYQRSGTTFTLLTNPSTLPASVANGITWSLNAELLAVAHDLSPFVTIYQRSGTTFTKITDPVSGLPAGSGKSVSFTPNGEFLAVGHANAPYLTTYQTSGLITSDAILYVKEVERG